MLTKITSGTVTDWIDLSQIEHIVWAHGDLLATIHLRSGHCISLAQERLAELIEQINGRAAAQVITHDQAPTPAATTITTKLLAMTRDTTKSGGTMWRCSTERGFMVNVFQHDDPLKDSFTLFVTAGYGPDMTTLEPGETLNWLQHPVQVELRASGAFWNVVTVTTRPADALPDAPEADAEA